MIFARRGAKCVYGSVWHIIKLVACDKNRARGSERNIAVSAFNCIRSYGRRRIVARSDNYFDVFVQSELIGNGFFERPYRLIALIYLRQILFAYAKHGQHGLRPAAVFRVEIQCARRIGAVGRKHSAEPVCNIVLRQHYLFYFLEILRFIVFQPKYFRRGEAGERDVSRVLLERLFADNIVKIFGLKRASAVVPQNGGTDHIVVFVEHDKAVHLPRKADGDNTVSVNVRYKLFYYRNAAVIPVLRILLAPTVFGIIEGVLS